MMWSSFLHVPPSFLRRAAAIPALVVFASLASCDTFDSILEGEAPAEQFLRIGWPLGEIPAVIGETKVVNVAITRLEDYDHKVSVSVADFPTGITGTVATTGNGDAVTAAITLSISPTLSTGLYNFTLRVGGERLKAASRSVRIRVLNPPTFTIGVTEPTIGVVRGGILPVNVTVVRDNYTQPITLELQSAGGLTATFSPNPMSGTTATAVIEVADDAPPGSHAVTVVGNPLSSAPVSTEFEVSVLPDELQIVAEPTLTTRQGRSVRKNFILNARSTVGDVSLAASDLPDGVEAAFSPVAGHEYAISMSVSPLVAAGTYPFSVVASAPGIPEAIADMVLVVQPSSIGITAFPTAVSVFRGAATTTGIALVRESLDTTVAITFESLPTGLTASATPALLEGDLATVTFEASDATPTGTHSVNLVATPSGWPASAAARRSMQVTVRAAPAGAGNVYLDWSACGAPDWLAVQDGVGPWIAVSATGEATRVSITDPRGGIAWVRGDSLHVRYQAQTEFTDLPENLCPSPRHSRYASGSGVHQNTGEQYVYGFGGATTTSRLAAPSFSLSGIAPGIHDLVVWGTTISPNFQPRGLIRRDQDLPDGGSFGAIDVTSEESFTPVSGSLSVGALNQGFLVATMNYLTRESCSLVPMYDLNLALQQGVWRATMLGVPSTHQRPRDLHYVTVRQVVGSRETSLGFTFHEFAARSATLPPNTGAPGIGEIPTPYRRIQMTTGTLQNAYNRSVAFDYSGGGRHVRMVMTRAYNPAFNVSLVLPDFSSVPGWSNDFVPAANAGVNWTATYRGGNHENPCATGFSSAAIRFTGSR